MASYNPSTGLLDIEETPFRQLQADDAIITNTLLLNGVLIDPNLYIKVDDISLNLTELTSQVSTNTSNISANASAITTKLSKTGDTATGNYVFKNLSTTPNFNSDWKYTTWWGSELAYSRLNISHFYDGSKYIARILQQETNQGLMIDCARGSGYFPGVKLLENTAQMYAYDDVELRSESTSGHINFKFATNTPFSLSNTQATYTVPISGTTIYGTGDITTEGTFHGSTANFGGKVFDKPTSQTWRVKTLDYDDNGFDTRLEETTTALNVTQNKWYGTEHNFVSPSGVAEMQIDTANNKITVLNDFDVCGNLTASVITDLSNNVRQNSGDLTDVSGRVFVNEGHITELSNNKLDKAGGTMTAPLTMDLTTYTYRFQDYGDGFQLFVSDSTKQNLAERLRIGGPGGSSGWFNIFVNMYPEYNIIFKQNNGINFRDSGNNNKLLTYNTTAGKLYFDGQPIGIDYLPLSLTGLTTVSQNSNKLTFDGDVDVYGGLKVYGELTMNDAIDLNITGIPSNTTGKLYYDTNFIGGGLKFGTMNISDMHVRLGIAEGAIQTNSSNISTNTSNISTNTGNISTNASNISTNTGNISTNATNISANATAIGGKVSKTGDTMTGDLALSGNVGIDFYNANVPASTTNKVYYNPVDFQLYFDGNPIGFDKLPLSGGTLTGTLKTTGCRVYAPTVGTLQWLGMEYANNLTSTGEVGSIKYYTPYTQVDPAITFYMASTGSGGQNYARVALGNTEILSGKSITFDANSVLPAKTTDALYRGTDNHLYYNGVQCDAPGSSYINPYWSHTPGYLTAHLDASFTSIKFDGGAESWHDASIDCSINLFISTCTAPERISCTYDNSLRSNYSFSSYYHVKDLIANDTFMGYDNVFTLIGKKWAQADDSITIGFYDSDDSCIRKNYAEGMIFKDNNKFSWYKGSQEVMNVTASSGLSTICGDGTARGLQFNTTSGTSLLYANALVQLNAPTVILANSTSTYVRASRTIAFDDAYPTLMVKLASNGQYTNTFHPMYGGVSSYYDAGDHVWRAKNIYGGITAQIGLLNGNAFYCPGGNVYAVSDQRLKCDIEDCNDTECLELVNKLKPVKYNYQDPDRQSKLKGKQYGFIAQDLEKLIPNGVQQVKGELPDILKYCRVENYVLTLDHTLAVGDVLCLREITDEYDYPHIIEEVLSSNTYRLKQPDNPENRGTFNAFCYGHIVQDKRIVNKDAIFTLTVSAIQELDRKDIALREQNAELKLKVASLESKLNILTQAIVKAGLL